jgi:PQQ-dependent dehydrogenase (methanol/ethanol family)
LISKHLKNFLPAMPMSNRSTYAGIAFAVLSVGSLLAQGAVTPDAVTNPFAGKPAAVAAGKVLYEQTCQSCHGGEARGDRGPALANGNFKHGGEDTDIFQTVRTGVPGTQMPAFSTLSTDNIWRIITYLRSLSESSAGAREVVPGNVAMGEMTFRTKGGCTACHEVNGSGGIVGPDLSAVGTNSAEYLRSMIVNPNEPAKKTGRSQRTVTVSVKTRDGKQIHGIRVAEDIYNLILLDETGKKFQFSKQDLLERNDETKSLMPDNYAQVLLQPEIQNLVAYLKTLGARDFSKTIQANIPGGLSFDRLRNAHAEPQNWPTYWGDYQGHHFSSLKQITSANVNQLQARWSLQMPGNSILEATPLVVDGTVYTTGTSGQVLAIDARSGLQIWKYERRQKVVNPYETNPFNRGVAILGNRVFVGTLDAALVSLDARTGRVLWETQIADTLKGYTITGAPLAVKGMIIVGVAGGEFGIRGFLDAYDAATGKRLWRFNSTPGTGEFGNDSWSGDSWKQGSGGTWLTGSYDAELDTLYWTVGNPGPNLNGSGRTGDNLFTCSVIALDPTTGTRKWHYQFTPHDTHDWDAVEDVVLADQTINGKKRKLIMQANRNGMFYVLDRTNGQFLFAKSFVKQTWNIGFEKNGRPIFAPDWTSSPEGATVYPNLGGGTNWQSPSYDPMSAWLYITTRDSGGGI